jgi:hypothetical protein
MVFLLKDQIRGRFRESILEMFINGAIDPPVPFVESEVFINQLEQNLEKNISTVFKNKVRSSYGLPEAINYDD